MSSLLLGVGLPEPIITVLFFSSQFTATPRASAIKRTPTNVLLSIITCGASHTTPLTLILIEDASTAAGMLRMVKKTKKLRKIFFFTGPPPCFFK
jgi:hypothetical protein